MKRTESKTPLQTYETSGKELRIYWDEQIVERPGMDAEPPETFYSYATASAAKATGYSALVTDIIRSQYTPDQEFAAINSGGDRYQSLLDFRVLAKQLARGYLGLPEPSVEDQRKDAILTRARFKLALLEGGYLEDVEAAYPSWPKAVQIMWDDSSTFERLHPELLALAAAMGYTDEQLDAIFGIGA